MKSSWAKSDQVFYLGTCILLRQGQPGYWARLHPGWWSHQPRTGSSIHHSWAREMEIMQQKQVTPTWWPAEGVLRWRETSCCPWSHCQAAPEFQQPRTPRQLPCRLESLHAPFWHSFIPHWITSYKIEVLFSLKVMVDLYLNIREFLDIYKTYLLL